MELSQRHSACEDASSGSVAQGKFSFARPCLLASWYCLIPLTILKKYSKGCTLTSFELPIDSYCEIFCAVVGKYDYYLPHKTFFSIDLYNV